MLSTEKDLSESDFIEHIKECCGFNYEVILAVINYAYPENSYNDKIENLSMFINLSNANSVIAAFTELYKSVELHLVINHEIIRKTVLSVHGAQNQKTFTPTKQESAVKQSVIRKPKSIDTTISINDDIITPIPVDVLFITNPNLDDGSRYPYEEMEKVYKCNRGNLMNYWGQPVVKAPDGIYNGYNTVYSTDIYYGEICQVCKQKIELPALNISTKLAG